MRYIILLTLLPSLSFAQPNGQWDDEKIEVKSGEENHEIISAEQLHKEGWTDLNHPQLWKQIMLLSPDSCIINIAATRTIIERKSNADWHSQTEEEKEAYRDSIRKLHDLEEDARIYVTTGKNDFYKFETVYPSLSTGVEVFELHGVDPWYAQSILLIESPGQMKKSRAGAYGPFQLMPGVARAQGLVVNRYKDERSNFERSAYGAANLIKTICIPEAKRILDSHGLKYDESDTWFRLFVLHVYHAGSLNVKAVVDKINPEVGGQSLIQSMWVTSAAKFGNNSQNYSQLALAAHLLLDELVHNEWEHDYILECNID